MSEIKSKFDVRGSGVFAEWLNTLKFTGFVAAAFIAWFFYGALVRRAYAKACREQREYCVDNMPGGKRS